MGIPDTRYGSWTNGDAVAREHEASESTLRGQDGKG